MSMREGTITQIDYPKEGTMGRFIRVYFSLKPDNTWAKMDLCPTFRNYARWKDHLEIGATFDNLKMKDAVTVDADSYPRRLNVSTP